MLLEMIFVGGLAANAWVWDGHRNGEQTDSYMKIG